MNSDETNPGPSSANNASPKPDSASNLKGRRGRGPIRPSGLGPVNPASAKTTFGIVTDLAGARESLSGQHARGYVGGNEERREPVEERVEEFRDETVREDRRERREASPPPPAVEAFRDEEVREPRRGRGEERRTPPPTPPVEGFRDEAVRPPRPERPPPAGAPRAQPVEGYRDEPVRERRERDQPARERAPDREQFRRRGDQSESDGGHRNEYINLMPDPANDPSPRRLRTETANPPPRVEDYAPSRSARVPDKVVPLDRSQRSRDGSTGGKERPKAHATIDISRRSESGSRSASSGGGLLSMIKRVLGFGESPAKAESKVETPRPASGDGIQPHSGGEPDAGRDGQRDGERHRRRRRGGRGRGGRNHGSDGPPHSGQS